MTLELHTVEIRGRDNLSPALKSIGTTSSQTARQVESDFDRAGRSSEQAGQRFSKAGAAIGAAMGGAVLLLGEFGRAAAEEEAVFARLEQSIEATGESYEAYGESINRAIDRGLQMSFADDEIAAALARMTTTTGDAQAALDNIGLAMDLARARGIDLSAAADLIGKAYTGNFAALSRYGIQLDANATSTEALAAIQARTAGQAEAYANTQAGATDRWKNKLDDLEESLGAHAGSIATVVALLPGLTAGWTLAAGAAGGLTGALGGGAGATAALTAFGGALATVAGAAAIAAPGILAIGYAAATATDNLNKVRTETEKLNEALTKTGGAGNEDLTRTYQLFRDMDNLIEVNYGNTTETLESSFDELIALRGEFATEFQNFANQTIDWSLPITKQETAVKDLIVRVHELYDAQQDLMWLEHDQAIQRERSTVELNRAAVAGQPSGQRDFRDVDQGYTGPYQPARGVDPMAGQRRTEGRPQPIPGGEITFLPQIQGLHDYREALAAGRVELELLNGAQLTAADAQTTLHVTQTNLTQEQGVYNQQQSEYQTQLNAVTAAEELLNQRKADGVAITKEQQEFLDGADAAQERLTGGAEDAIIAQGMLGEQYAENMRIGDQLNASMEGNSESTGLLTDSINALIAALGGVPPMTVAEVTDNGTASLTKEEVEAAIAAMNNLDGMLSLATVDADATAFWYAVGQIQGATVAHAYVALDYVPGSVTSPFQHGGMIPAAQHGRVLGGSYTLVGEAGPELLLGGQGGMVLPAAASRVDKRSRRGGGGDTFVIQSLTVLANSPQQMTAQLREHAYGGVRP